MSLLFAVICGVIQGAAEFLPISSSGHLALFQRLFMRDPGSADLLAFNVLLHVGTLFAVFTVYGKDILRLIPAFFRVCAKILRGRFSARELTEDERLAAMTALGTAPMLLAKLIDDRVELISAYAAAVGTILILNSAMLFAADRIRAGKPDGTSARPATALAVGLAQCAAVLPGLSRSGSSITAGLACGYERSFAVKFSFILSVPAILGAAVFELPDALSGGVPAADLPACAAGAVTAFICGVGAIKLLGAVSRRRGFAPFAVYSLAVGIIAVICGATGVRFPVF